VFKINQSDTKKAVNTAEVVSLLVVVLDTMRQAFAMEILPFHCTEFGES
jgi:hypothetical protein